jgi:hypothetical protein
VSDTFGDYEPEDAWHPDDSPGEQVENLRRRLILLLAAALAGDDDFELRDVLRLIAAFVAITRLRDLTGRALLRADQLDEDIAFIRARLGP